MCTSSSGRHVCTAGCRHAHRQIVVVVERKTSCSDESCFTESASDVRCHHTEQQTRRACHSSVTNSCLTCRIRNIPHHHHQLLQQTFRTVGQRLDILRYKHHNTDAKNLSESILQEVFGA